MSIYEIPVKKTNGEEISLKEYENKVIMIVNTASNCGFTPQFQELETLYKKYKDRHFMVLGFPCNQFLKQDPKSNEEIVSFCQLNFGVTFPMFAKIEVNGVGESPLYTFLKQAQKGALTRNIKWNFTKFLIDSQGNVVRRFAPRVKPLEIESEIVALLDKS